MDEANNAVSAAVVSGDIKIKEAEKFPFNRPLTKEAAKMYNNPGRLFPTEVGIEHSAANKYLPFNGICFLAKALGRQITTDDLSLLLVDEGVHECVISGQKFRGISWPLLTKKANEIVTRMTSEGKSFEEIVHEAFVFCGPFWVLNHEEIVAVSGTPADEDEAISPLKQAYNQSGQRWGEPLAKVTQRVKDHKNCRRNFEKKAKNLFSNLGASWPKTKR